jgi:hypothetical protein
LAVRQFFTCLRIGPWTRWSVVGGRLPQIK